MKSYLWDGKTKDPVLKDIVNLQKVCFKVLRSGDVVQNPIEGNLSTMLRLVII